MLPIFRHALIADEVFSTTLSLVTDAAISFSPSGAAFQRSVLLAAVRAASTSDSTTAVTDQDGEAWSVRFDREQTPPFVVIEWDERVVQVRHLGLLSERPKDRWEMLEAEASHVNLPANDRARWAALIGERGLSDAEVSDFAEDIHATPVGALAEKGAPVAIFGERFFGSHHGKWMW